jgi:hypothetical protein
MDISLFLGEENDRSGAHHRDKISEGASAKGRGDQAPFNASVSTGTSVAGGRHLACGFQP